MSALFERRKSDQEVIAELRRVLADITVRNGHRISASSDSPETETARRIYAARLDRDAASPDLADLFHDPAWDILLDLFVAAETNAQVAVSSACIGANVAATTALRMLTTLEERRVVERTADPFDRRRRFVRLSPVMHDRLRLLFAKWTETPILG